MSETKFSCSSCGQHIQADEAYQGMQIECPSCHASIAVPSQVAEIPALRRPGANRPAAPPGGVAPASGLAKASLILSAASLVAGPFGFIPGIVCGHMARKRIACNPRIGGKGIATAGLMLGYGFLALSLLMAGILATMLVKTAGRIQQQTQQALHQTPPAATMMAKGGPVNDGAWKTDLTGVSIPDTPLSGRVHGVPFVCDYAELSPAMKPLFLILKQGQGLQGDVKITVIAGDSRGLEGRSLSFATTGEIPADADYRVEILRRENGGYTPRHFSRIQDGFVMRLDCQPRVGDHVKGRIYLCFGDEQKSYVAGSFDAKLR